MRNPLNRTTEVNKTFKQKRSLQAFFSLLPFALILLADPAQAARLQTWRFNAGQNQLTFTTDEGVQPTAQLIANPTRLVVDLPGVTLGRPAVSEAYTGNVRALRVGQFDRGITRLVVELAPGYTLDPAQVRFQGATPQQWSVQLPRPQLASTANPSAPIIPPGSVVVPTKPSGGGLFPVPPPGSAQIPIPVPLPANPSPVRPPVLPTPAIPPAQPRPVVPPRTPVSNAVVVIDAGHGGPDPGAVGIGGLREKDVVIDISRQVAVLLQQQGIRAVMTRSSDVDLDLAPRTTLANRLNATAFVSIHANAISMSRPDVNGIETFYYQSGLGLAQAIQRSMLQATGARDRGVKQARFYVLRYTSMPSALVEVGFVTGREDAAKLATAAHRKTLAESIARGIVQYLGQQRR
ncbi:N-acetylmuramoyl-L-alanine amidase [Myxacorys almedinensis]|uniref:AMIN domain-containing protein n=1 Tax=Myxacorys almedinensis A TaxID=2690445 RepID=A0A8J8CLW3_9CYAN|nr:N-acetylmuramoyl-L-alanine amidase [Myxacorys almedinensis]NDJ18170.1 AMIN domain-containing protein [Myxacorys almedinensis A]